MFSSEIITADILETVSEEVVSPVEESKPPIFVDKDDVKILVRADGAPGMWLGDDKEVHGFYVDLEKMVMKEMGQVFIFVPYYDI